MDQLTSLQNPLVKQVRKLHYLKYRRLYQQFLLEGTHLVQEAVLAQWPLDVLLCTAAWQHKETSLFQQLHRTVPRIEQVSPELLAAITTTLNPDGVVAVAHSGSKTFPSLHSLGLVLEDLQDPGNMGTILRTAAATDVEGVLVSANSVDLANPKVLRASAGAWFRVSAVQVPQVLNEIERCQAQGFQVVVTTPRAAIDYWTVDYTQPTLLVVGNEGAGLSEALLAQPYCQVSIPLSAGVESLNVAIATAVLLYEVKRQRTLALTR